MNSAWELTLRLSLWMSLPINLGGAYVLANPASWPGRMLGLPADTHPLYTGLTAILVALFGLAYGWLALSEPVHTPLLTVGAAGKAGFFLLVAGLWWLGQASTLLLVASTADLALAALWSAWLVTAART